MEFLVKIWQKNRKSHLNDFESYPLDPLFSEIFAVEQIFILAFYIHVTDKKLSLFLN